MNSKINKHLLRVIALLLLTATLMLTTACGEKDDDDKDKDDNIKSEYYDVYDTPESLAEAYLEARYGRMDAKDAMNMFYPDYVQYRKDRDHITYRTGQAALDEEKEESEEEYGECYYTYGFDYVSEIQEYYVDTIEDFYEKEFDATVEEIKFLNFHYTLYYNEDEEAYTNDYGVYAVKIDGYWYLTSDYFYD